MMILVQLKLIRTWLEPMGFAVLTADSVPKALELLAANHPVALCLVDWHMYPWSGPAFIAAIRQESRFNDLPILAFTADNSAEAIREAAGLKVDGYILKPLHRRTLAEKLLKLDVIEKVPAEPPPPGMPAAVEGRETLRIKIPQAEDTADDETRAINRP